MTCRLDNKTAQQDAWEPFEVIELSTDMDSSFKSFTLTRGSISSTLKSRKSIASSSVDSGLESEYTQVQNGLADVHPSMWITIKYPIEADDASPNGMLSQTDFDAVLQAIQQEFTNWQIFLETKRTTNYCKYAQPLTATTAPPKHRIIVKVKFSAWVTKINTKHIQMAVNEVMNKEDEFYIEVQPEKIKTKSSS